MLESRDQSPLHLRISQECLRTRSTREYAASAPQHRVILTAQQQKAKRKETSAHSSYSSTARLCYSTSQTDRVLSCISSCCYAKMTPIWGLIMGTFRLTPDPALLRRCLPYGCSLTESGLVHMEGEREGPCTADGSHWNPLVDLWFITRVPLNALTLIYRSVLWNVAIQSISRLIATKLGFWFSFLSQIKKEA